MKKSSILFEIAKLSINLFAGIYLFHLASGIRQDYQSHHIFVSLYIFGIFCLIFFFNGLKNLYRKYKSDELGTE